MKVGYEATCISAFKRGLGIRGGLDRAPSVLTVAVAFAEVGVVYVAGFVLEFEIPDPGWILVVMYTVPKWPQ